MIGIISEPCTVGRNGQDISRRVVAVGISDRRALGIGVAAVGVMRFAQQLILVAVVVGVMHLRAADRAAGNRLRLLNFQRVAERDTSPQHVKSL